MSAARDRGDARASRLRRGAAAALTAAVLAVPLAVAAPVAAVSRDVATAAAVSIVVPVTARAGADGVLDAAALETATGPLGSLTRELDELLTTTATIGLDPMIPASIRVLGSQAPESAVSWLRRLEAAPNEVFLLAYADADPTPFARTGTLDLAAPVALDHLLDPGAFGPPEPSTPTPTATPSPTDTPDPTETPGATASPAPTPSEPDDGTPPPLPTTEDLLAWSNTIARIAWPSEGSAAPTDIAAYAAAGYDAVLLSTSNVSETRNGLADVGGLRAIIADSPASTLFQQASTSIDDATRQAAINRLGAALDGLAAEQPGRSVVLTLARSATFSFYGLEETFAAIDARSSTRVVGLSEVLTGSPDGASVIENTVPASIPLMPSFLGSLSAEEAFATILTDPILITAPRRLDLLALLSVPGLDDVAGWEERADAFLEESAAILSSVSIGDTGGILVTSTETAVPVKVSNALAFPVTVRIDARALRPLLRIDSPVEVTVEPESSKTVRLDAQAITNGSVTIEVSLSSPSTGVAIGDSRRFDAELQAQWETVGIVVGSLVALVFAVGIVRNVVVRRRKAALEHVEGADGAPEPE